MAGPGPVRPGSVPRGRGRRVRPGPAGRRTPGHGPPVPGGVRGAAAPRPHAAGAAAGGLHGGRRRGQPGADPDAARPRAARERAPGRERGGRMTSLDHRRVPVLEALEAFRERGDLRFGPPGHRQGKGADPRVLDIVGAGVFASDVLVLNGLDDRRQSQGVIEQAQELMADAVGAEHAFFSTCGSSLSVKSAMLAVAGPGEKLLISRNAHKSVMSAVIVNGTDPVWLHPKFDAERHLAHPPEPDDVRRALEANPDAKGVLLITPTDWGSCADIQGTADVCHELDVVLIVDEAWGAHLPFHDDLPEWGMNCDADLVVTSVHKMGGAIEQSSVFHLQGDRVDPTVLKQRMDILGTTSASSLVFATLDGWRRQMVEHGTELLGAAVALARQLREEVEGIDGLTLMGDEIVDEGYAHELDPLVLTVD